MSEQKEYQYKMNPNGLYYISYSTGGVIPKPLTGGYTSANEAKSAAETYKKGCFRPTPKTKKKTTK